MPTSRSTFNTRRRQVRSLFELDGIPVVEWTDAELIAHLGWLDVRSEARSRGIV